nr:VOC family protein [Allonocardiopsis opalescens]
MFAQSRPFSGFSIDDAEAARHFYAETLGMEVSDVPGMPGMLLLHIPGGNQVFLYSKPDHRPASFTVLNFPVADIDAAVDTLIERGVRFERYEGMGMAADARGVHRGGEGPAIAWFTDPAGNVLSVLQDG